MFGYFSTVSYDMSLKSNPIIRIFSGDKTVRGTALNLFGAQVLRMLTARSLYAARSAPVDNDIQDYVNEVKREGMIAIPDFLKPEQFNAVREEYLNIFRNTSRSQILTRGSNTVELIFLKDLNQADAKDAGKYFFYNPKLRAIFHALEKQPLDSLRATMSFELLTQHDGDTADPETKFHNDIFYNTHKAWLYLDDVAEENGPLVYVKRSHHLSPCQLLYVYKESLGKNEGSRRITPQEIVRRELTETRCVCARNTLVIANTFGYHRRMRGKPGNQRHALNISARITSPFQLLLPSGMIHNTHRAADSSVMM